jgi:hypothetical protein
MPKRHEFKTEAEWLEHLRLWFAGMALQGWCSTMQDKNARIWVKEEGVQSVLSITASACYRYADAMLTERTKP